jgi:hypothetical protein
MEHERLPCQKLDEGLYKNNFLSSVKQIVILTAENSNLLSTHRSIEAERNVKDQYE